MYNNGPKYHDPNIINYENEYEYNNAYDQNDGYGRVELAQQLNPNYGYNPNQTPIVQPNFPIQGYNQVGFPWNGQNQGTTLS